MGLALGIAILFNALLPFFATYSEAAAPSGLASVFGEKVLICTGQGFALVNWKDLKAGKIPVHRDKSASCPLCYIAASGFDTLLLPAIILLLASAMLWQRAAMRRAVGNSRTWFCNTSCPRAPPVVPCY